MQTVGGYSDFRTQSEFEPVGETGARIPVDRGGVDLVEKLFGPGMTLGQDGLAVSASEPVDEVDGLFH